MPKPELHIEHDCEYLILTLLTFTTFNLHEHIQIIVDMFKQRFIWYHKDTRPGYGYVCTLFKKPGYTLSNHKNTIT